MGIEIERKFLLKSDLWRQELSQPPIQLMQGYFLRAEGGATTRIRVAGIKGILTIKGATTLGMRSEFEYEIPLEDAQAMLKEFCGTRIVKKLRYIIPAGNGLTWEIDEYLENNAGLFTAEIELPELKTSFAVPAWLGREVTGDRRFNNSALSRHPYNSWSEQERL